MNRGEKLNIVVLIWLIGCKTRAELLLQLDGPCPMPAVPKHWTTAKEVHV